jgi:transcriptional regulator with XRE-family HTH domain
MTASIASGPRLCEVLRQFRWAARLELKAVAADIGISDSVLSRFERGENIAGESLIKIVRWLLSDAAPAVEPQQSLLMIENQREAT